MLNTIRGLLKIPLKLIPLVVFGILLTSTINIAITYINYDVMKEDIDRINQEGKNDIWYEISEIIEENYYNNKLASKIISLNLEKSIIKNYTDLDELEKEFDKGIYSQDFYNILKENIERNDLEIELKHIPYFTIVGKLDSVLVTFSNNDTIGLGKVNTNYVFTWKDVASLTPNPSLTMKAVDKILNNESGVIFTQTSPFEDNYKFPEKITMDTLKRVYDEKGIEGLGKFSLLAPSYITETGDIFNNEDKYYLSKNYTHKIITVQVVSINEILKENKNYLQLKEKQNEYRIDYIEKRMLNDLITSSLISIMLFIISLFLIGIHNAETERKRIGCKECSKEGE